MNISIVFYINEGFLKAENNFLIVLFIQDDNSRATSKFPLLVAC
jgi:hypothetical protein